MAMANSPEGWPDINDMDTMSDAARRIFLAARAEFARSAGVPEREFYRPKELLAIPDVIAIAERRGFVVRQNLKRGKGQLFLGHPSFNKEFQILVEDWGVPFTPVFRLPEGPTPKMVLEWEIWAAFYSPDPRAEQMVRDLQAAWSAAGRVPAPQSVDLPEGLSFDRRDTVMWKTSVEVLTQPAPPPLRPRPRPPQN